MHREGIGNYTACQSIWRMTVQGGHLECVYSFWRSSISAGKADVSTCLHIWSGAVKILQQLIISGDLLQVLWCVLIKFGVKNKLSIWKTEWGLSWELFFTGFQRYWVVFKPFKPYCCFGCWGLQGSLVLSYSISLTGLATQNGNKSNPQEYRFLQIGLWPSWAISSYEAVSLISNNNNWSQRKWSIFVVCGTEWKSFEFTG